MKLRANSEGNENEMVRERNSEFGFLAYEFLNEIAFNQNHSDDDDDSIDFFDNSEFSEIID